MAIPTTGYDSATISNPDSALTDFTLMIDLSEMSASWLSAWNTDDNGRGRASKSDGTTELACDWIDLDNSAGTGWLRVKYTGTLASTGTQIIRIFPPLSTNSQYSASDTYGSDNAYDSDWLGYWPLISDFVDRTSNGLNGSGSGGVTAGDITGHLGDATGFDGIDDLISVGTSSGIGFTSAVGTVGAFANIDNASTTLDALMGQNTNNSDAFTIYVYDNKYSACSWNDYGTNLTSAVIAGTWHMVTATVDGINTTVFLDGVEEDTSVTSNFSTIARQFQLGNRGSSDSAHYFEGGIQHAFAHAITRSDDWISEEYSQTNDNATFWGTWAWTSPGPGGSIAVLRRRILGYSVIFNLTNLLLLLNTISGYLLTHTMMKLRQAQKQLEWYAKPENIKNLAIVEKFLEESHA